MKTNTSLLKRKKASLCILIGICAVSLCVIFYSDGQAGEKGGTSYTVTIRHYGVDAREMERSAAVPLEDALSAIPGVRSVHSSSENSMARVFVNFSRNSRGRYEAVRDAAQRVYENLPSSVQRPEIQSSDNSVIPVWSAAVFGNYSIAENDASDTALLLERIVKPRLESLDGTAEVLISGTGLQEIVVALDQEKAAALGINPSAAAAILSMNDALFPAGILNCQGREIIVTVDGRYDSTAALAQAFVPLGEGNAVPLGNIAHIYEQERKPDTFSRLNGKRTAVISLMGSSGADLRKLSKNIQKELALLALPLEFTVLSDRGAEEEAAFRSVFSAALQGGLMVGFACFLLNKRKTNSASPELKFTGFFCALAIPAICLVSSALLAITGLPLNRSVLAGLAAAVGSAVDPVILCSERLRKSGTFAGAEAALKQLRGPLFAGAATTIAALLPLGSMDTEAALIAFAISVITLTALALSLTLLPPLLLWDLGTSRTKIALLNIPFKLKYIESLNSTVMRFFNPLFCRVSRTLCRLFALTVRMCVCRPVWILSAAAVLSTAAVCTLVIRGTDSEMYGSENSLYARVEFEGGLVAEETDRLLAEYGETLAGKTGINHVETGARTGSGNLLVSFDSKLISPDKARELARSVPVPGGFVFFPETPSNERYWEIKVFGDDDQKCRELAEELARLSAGFPLVKDRVLNFKEGSKKLLLLPDRERITKSGISFSLVSDAAHRGIYGPVSYKRLGPGGEVDLRVRTGTEEPSRAGALGILVSPVNREKGPLMIEGVTRIKEGIEPSSLRREDRRPVASITISTKPMDPRRVKKALAGLLEKTDLPPGYSIEFDPEAVRQAEALSKTCFSLLLALIFCYMVIAAVNESFTVPLAVLSAVPPSLAIPALYLAISGSPFNVAAACAFVVVSGMTVNAAIICAGGIKFLPQTGGGEKGLFLYLVLRRKIPALIATAGTTIAGVLPFLLLREKTNSLIRTLSLVTALGVAFSCICSISVVPALLIFFSRVFRKKKFRLSGSKICLRLKDMKKIICQKLITASIAFVMGLSSVTGFAQTNPDPRSAGSLFNGSSPEVKGFDKTIFDYHFSKADREISPDRWISEARRGIGLAINAWELFASDLYDSPLLLESAKRQIEEWSSDELEDRFTRWLTGRFFGAAAEKVITEMALSLDDNHQRYTWHHDSDGNIAYDDKTGDPLVVRPGERDFSLDLPLWRGEAEQKIITMSSSFADTITRMYPELLAYIPMEMRDSLSGRIAFTVSSFSQTLQNEFENIAAREERVFTSRRTGDVWSLRKKSDDEAAYSITAQIIEEVENICAKGIAGLASRIEEASAGTGDLALMGKEWLDMYREQFDRGLKAWEQAEERFFIRRIEWEQESVRLFTTGEETWVAAFNQFETERKNWELKTKTLFESGEALFKNASDNLERAITGAKIEFERDFQIRTEAGTVRAQALIDMYLTSCTGAAAARENIQFWLKQYSSRNKMDPADPSFANWLEGEIKKNDTSGTLSEIDKSFQLYTDYLEKAEESREKIIADYNVLIGSGRLKDVLSNGVSSEDFSLDEYQAALIRAKAAVQYWERQTAIAEAVSRYAEDLSAGRMTEAESLRAWESAKAAYNQSLTRYEKELQTLSSSGASLREKQAALNGLAVEMKESEKTLESLNQDYSTLIAVNAINRENYVLEEFNLKYSDLLAKYRLLNRTGGDAVYKNFLEYALELGAARQRETAEAAAWLLINGDSENMKSLSQMREAAVPGSDAEIDLRIRLSGIDLFSAESGALWYSGVWGINPSKYENTALTGKNLKERLIADVEKSLQAGDEAGYRFSRGLLELYENFGGAAPFVIKEAWQDTVYDLGLLYAGYGIGSQPSLLPDVEELYRVLLRQPGDFALNAARFLHKFDSCFNLIPEWLVAEINNWKEIFCEYIALNALYNGKTPEKKMAALSVEQESIERRYRALEDYYNSASFDDTEMLQKIKTQYAEIYEDEMLLSYRSLVTGIWEQNIKQASDAEKEKTKHWRQYLAAGYIDETKSEPFISAAISAASSWKQGIMLDALDNVVFNTGRINAVFSLYGSHDWKMRSRETEFLSNLYETEAAKIQNQHNIIAGLREDLARLGRGYENSKVAPDVLKGELDRQYSTIKSQEAASSDSRKRYLLDAELFAAAGSLYDEQYTRAKKAFENTEAKRFEYETQDAIRRWASTAYLDHESGDLDNCRNHLIKAQTVLAVLSNLYNNEEVRPYENPAYQAMYSEYEQSFKKALVSLKVYNILNKAITDEKTKNDKIFNNYQNCLYMLGNAPEYEVDYISSSNRSEWSIKDIVTLNNGMLAFSRNLFAKLDGIDKQDASMLCDYFNQNKTIASGRHEISQFETALFDLNQRMNGYFSDSKKYSQWGLARDYLIRVLIESNEDVSFLQSEYVKAAPLAGGGSLAGSPYKAGLFESIEYIGDYISGKQGDFREDQKKAWEGLSTQERTDLEFYVILSLSGNSNSYGYGFSQYTALKEYQTAYDKAKQHYDEANDKVSNWFLIGLAFIEMQEINKATYRRLEPPIDQTKKYIQKWEVGLEANINMVTGYSSAYINSCKKLNMLEGIAAPGQSIKWDDIHRVLTQAGGVNDEELSIIRDCWEAKIRNGGGKGGSVIDGLRELALWTSAERDKSKKALDNQWYLDNQNRQKMENNFLKTVDAYMAGETGAGALAAAANAAYGKNTAAWKTHYTNIENTLIRDLELFPAYGFDYLEKFSELGKEYISLAVRTLSNRYYAEFAVRETEWKEQRLDLADKYLEWRETAALLTERGREDWKDSAKRLEANYKQWNVHFLEEQKRISLSWADAYLAGLEDKEKWLEQAAAAADRASSDALLRAVGAEAERLARFVDTREPLGIRDAVPETKKILAELLNKPGLGNIESIFGVMGNMGNLGAQAVRRGMSGSGLWDANIVKAAAVDMAQKTNAEIADREAKRLAYNAQATVMEALKSLSANVDSANSSFRESMDKVYIVQGQWRKNGTKYIKDIIAGSTFFQPVITEEKKVEEYKGYRMDPVALKTNLDEDRLTGLNSFAVRGLIENVYQEIEALMAEIFGDGSKQEIQTGEGNDIQIRHLVSGKFGAHIGYEPVMKSPPGGTSRDSMFIDRGSGELGRLMTEFYYWSVIDGQGLAKLSIAIWDKPLWDDRGSSFTAPSIRSAAEIAGQVGAAVAGLVAAPFTGGASALGTMALIAGINTVDDLAFNALDAAYGYKTFDEAGFAFGKAVAVSSASSFVSAGFSGVTGGLLAAGKDLSGAAAQVAMTGAQTFTSGVVTSAINGINYSHENGWAYSGEAFREGMINTLSSTVSALTSGTLTGINSGMNMEKLIGFSKMNMADLSKLNVSLGSLAGQGIQYAMGNDFTLNLLNTALLTEGNINTGLLELHVGRDGSPQMNFGTGGMDASPDTITGAVQGAFVWNINNRISRYTDNNVFKERVTLRAQYGFGSGKQKKQLKDILSGKTEIEIKNYAQYDAKTSIVDGKRVITLGSYRPGMSVEDQMRLAAIFGHEAYRDGYQTGTEKDFDELQNAVINKLLMADRINEDYQWFYDYNTDFAFERYLLDIAKESANMDLFNQYLRNTYRNGEDYYWQEVTNGGDYQNSRPYEDITLLNAEDPAITRKTNKENLDAALAAYKQHLAEQEGYTGDIADFKNKDGKTDEALKKELENDKTLQEQFGYKKLEVESLFLAGCAVFATKYGVEAFTNKPINAISLNNYIKENNLLIGTADLGRELIGEIMTRYSEGKYNFELLPMIHPTAAQLWEMGQSNDAYIAHLRIKNPETGKEHSQMLGSIDFNKNILLTSAAINTINTANPWNDKSTFTGKTSFDLNQITRWYIYKVTPTTPAAPSMLRRGQTPNSKAGVGNIWPYNKK